LDETTKKSQPMIGWLEKLWFFRGPPEPERFQCALAVDLPVSIARLIFATPPIARKSYR
jgi:hypothetical protein